MIQKLLAALCILLAAQSALAQSGTAQVSGRVVGADGKPIGLATVALVAAKDSATLKTTISKPDGSFTFERMRAGSYKLVISVTGYQHYSSLSRSATADGWYCHPSAWHPSAKHYKRLKSPDKKNT